MLKTPAGFVLASFGGSTYGSQYDSSPRSLRPRWTVVLTILRIFLTLSQKLHFS